MLSRTVAKVASTLYLHAESPLRLSQISRASGLPHQMAAAALQTLEKRGLVSRIAKDGYDAFEANRNSRYFIPAYLTALADLPLDEALRSQRVMSVYVYGSMATPDLATSQSDIDLLIVGDVKNKDILRESLNVIGDHLGRQIDPLILTPEEVGQAQAREDSHLTAALAGINIRGEKL